VLARLTRREAVNLAYSDVLWTMSALFFIALLIVPMMRRPAKSAQTATETH
jgi:hypothetical protein